ncbi:thiolase-like protein [Pseudomassariella vexata]|uniref:Thiolase-like protein n=1 Tax=Pseudomassariella vexata TaxID=1141098 RepID=A0A1Y2DWC0_9PEZI|nr:thiolase-like protein [Pseudomassariella vexata]ORY63489.1 thiolase-like protein [Pseudomassariella vexata]
MRLRLAKAADRPQYYEAHGTGTLAGDPIEAEAIQAVIFRQGFDHAEDKTLLVGSINTVIGHLKRIAVLAGMLKASLAIQHSLVPPNLHFVQLGPKIKPLHGHMRVPKAETS